VIFQDRLCHPISTYVKSCFMDSKGHRSSCDHSKQSSTVVSDAGEIGRRSTTINDISFREIFVKDVTRKLRKIAVHLCYFRFSLTSQLFLLSPFMKKHKTRVLFVCQSDEDRAVAAHSLSRLLTLHNIFDSFNNLSVSLKTQTARKEQFC